MIKFLRVLFSSETWRALWIALRRSRRDARAWRELIEIILYLALGVTIGLSFVGWYLYQFRFVTEDPGGKRFIGISVIEGIVLLSAGAAAWHLRKWQRRAQVFPKSSLDSVERAENLKRAAAFKARWYSLQLRALEEPSLIALAKDRDSESYRFLWLRTFNHPVAVRLEKQADGSFILVSKISSGAGGYDPGKLITNTSRQLTAAEAQQFLSKVDKVRFWKTPTSSDDDLRGCDGSQWIIEGVKSGKYHMVDRWCGSGLTRDLGEFLAFDLAKLKIPHSERY